MPSPESASIRKLSAAAYATALIVLVLPLIDTIVGTLPAQPGGVEWRFGAMGIASRALVTPFIALLIALGFSVAAEQYRVTRLIGFLSLVMCIVLVAIMGLFALDSVQMRASVQPGMRSAFDVTVAISFVKYIVATIGAAVFGMAGLRFSGKKAVATPRNPRTAVVMDR